MTDLFSPRSALGITLSALAAATALADLPTDWRFDLVCRSSVDGAIAPYRLPFPSSLSSQYVSLDEDGSVAIRVVLAGSPSEGFFYGDADTGSITLSGNSTDPIWSADIDLRSGMFVAGEFFAGAAVYDAATGALLFDYPPGGPAGVSSFSGPTLTNTGAIGYRGNFSTDKKNIIDEYLAGNRTQTEIADTFSGDYSFLFSPELNDNRFMAGNTIPASGPSRRIVRWDAAGTPTTVAQTGGDFNAFVNSVALAQSGDVAFTARRSADSTWQVTRWDGSSLTPIAAGSNPDINNSSLANFPPVINSGGLVAFRATDIAHDATALWVSDGTTTHKLIEYDQLIDTDLGPLALGFDFGGSDGRQVTNGVVDINDAGQVAFSAFLRNGTVGVFVATPITCPADLNGDGILNLLDVTAFIDAFLAADPLADINNDGLINLVDITDFIDAFAAGC